MASITLELATGIDGSTVEGTVVLEIVDHVHQRVERFRYLDDIKPSACGLDYLENHPIDSWNNIQIVNRTYGIGANADKHAEVRKGFSVTTSTGLSSEYKTLLVTDRVGAGKAGARRPLFWKHILPANTVQCYLEVIERGNRIEVDDGYLLDLTSGAIYTNYQNFFDPSTGAYRLFYLTCTDSAGGSFHQLLNPVSAVHEATWEDIDPSTGRLYTTYPSYSKERNSNGYSFYMSYGDTWYWKPVESSLIQPRRPVGRTSEDTWFLRFSAGDVTSVVNGTTKRYWVPEFDQQHYSPSKPYIYSPYERMMFVNDMVLATTRKNIAIDPDSGRHLTLFVYDYDDVLLRVLTTDTSLHGVRYSDTNVFYESDQVRSYDNTGGFVSLNTKLHPSYQVTAQYYWEADDYEYRLLDLNPVNNKTMLDHMAVFYIVPDVQADDRSVHHIIVDQKGTIRYCSQSLGLAYPNLQEYNSDGSVNADTVVGLKYASVLETDNFLQLYAAGYSNTNGYGILAEVSVTSVMDESRMRLYDIRKPGWSLVENTANEALLANPRVLQSEIYYGYDGQEVPKNKVLIIEAPLEMLEDYGGSLTEKQATDLLTRRLDSSVYPVVDWKYPACETTITSETTGQVDLGWTWEGPGVGYNLYRRDGNADVWTLIHTEADSATPVAMTYSDVQTTGETFYYTVRCTKIVGGTLQEFPRTYQTSVKVA